MQTNCVIAFVYRHFAIVKEAEVYITVSINSHVLPLIPRIRVRSVIRNPYRCVSESYVLPAVVVPHPDAQKHGIGSIPPHHWVVVASGRLVYNVILFNSEVMRCCRILVNAIISCIKPVTPVTYGRTFYPVEIITKVQLYDLVYRGFNNDFVFHVPVIIAVYPRTASRCCLQTSYIKLNRHIICVLVIHSYVK